MAVKQYSYGFFEQITKGNIVDLGCGSGIDVCEMAEKMGPSVQITGVDHDSEMIKVAREKAIKQVNTTFICSEASPLPFEKESVDGLRAERLMQHLKNPKEVTGEIHRVLKKNAPVVIVETDWQGMTCYTGHTVVENKIQQYLVQEKTNNGLASRRILDYLKQQSFKGAKKSIFPILLSSLKEANAVLKLEEIVAEMKNKNQLDSAEVEGFISTLREQDAENSFACSVDLLVFSAVK